MVKQAVIVVHGMGEQRPMGTLRDLVGAVAKKDDTYIIPDEATSTSELSRIRVTGPNDGDRTDFFELYYADLLAGGNFAQLRGWVLGLLLRWPHQVPREVWKIWAFLWIAVLFTLAWLGPMLADNPLGKIAEIFKASNAEGNKPSYFQVFLIVITALLLALQMALKARRHVESPLTTPDPRRTLLPIWSYLMPILVSTLLGFILWRAVPWRAFAWPDRDWCASDMWFICGYEIVYTFFSMVWVKLLVAAALWYGIKSFGVAYFGDVARYVDASHGGISSRAAIRERAVNLLQTLHHRKAFKDGVEIENKYEYDRILIVAHSLGSVVAYDAMRIFWALKNNSINRVITHDADAEFAELNRLASSSPADDDKSEGAIAWDNSYSDAQRAAFAKFSRGNPDWRISDFITLGSPLARADFLMSRDLPRFRVNTEERVFPTCPPLIEKDGKFFFFSQKAGGKTPHHAAMFSVTSWLAIFDPVRGWLFGGDFIGGPVRFLFGRGVQELAVKIERSGLLGNLVTHTNYWDTTVKTQLDLDKTNAQEKELFRNFKGQLVIELLKNRIWPQR